VTSSDGDDDIKVSHVSNAMTTNATGVSATAATSACGANPACKDLIGDCCPTAKGIYLGCCSSPASATAPDDDNAAHNVTAAAASDDERLSQHEVTGQVSSSCQGNIGCMDLGLEGECCPTLAGNYLGCCRFDS